MLKLPVKIPENTQITHNKNNTNPNDKIEQIKLILFNLK